MNPQPRQRTTPHPPPAAAPESDPRRTFFGLTPRTLLAVAALAVVPYLLLPAKPFVADSLVAIRDNPAVQSGPLLRLFVVDFWGVAPNLPAATGSYRPLVSGTYALQARTFGNVPQPFHLADMLLHVLATLLIAATLAVWRPSSTWIVPAAGLFAVHPAASEAVASMVGRADLLASLCFLGALYLHLRSALGRGVRRGVGWTIGLLAAALLCKEYAVAFPFVLIVVDLALEASGNSDPRHRAARRTVWLGALAALGLYLVTRYLLFGQLGSVPMLGAGDQPLFDKPWLARASTALSLYLTSGRLVFCPWPLSHFYNLGSLPVLDSPFAPRALGGIALIAALVAWSIARLRRQRDPWPAIASSIFVLTLAPSLNLFSLAGVLYAERYLYLPLAAVALWLGTALERLATLRTLARSAAWILIAVGAPMTALRVDQWRSSETLARATVAHYPQAATAWVEIGLAAGTEGRTAEAIEAFETALRVAPNRPMVWRNYGVALSRWAEADGLSADDRKARFQRAADAWRKALELSPPDLAPLWAGLGRAELGARRVEEAVRALGRAVELAPDTPETALLLGNALLGLAQQRLQEGNPAEAAQHAERAMAVAKLPPAGYFLSGLVLASAGRRAEADKAFETALQGDPEILEKLHARGVELSQAADHRGAAESFRQLLLARPDSVSTALNLARELLLLGRPGEAAPLLEELLARRPDLAIARAMLAETRRVAPGGAGR